MKKTVGIGACVSDLLIGLSHYPEEDTKLKADDLMKSGGGPVATGLVAVSKLGGNCEYIGNLSDDENGVFLKKDFEKYGVGTEQIKIMKGYSSFTSVIWLSRETSSRTCVFNRGNLPKLVLSKEDIERIKEADVLMVDGNELEAAIEGAKVARENGKKVLYDAGGLYDGVERLLKYANVLIPSREFALKHTKSDSVREAAKKLYEMYSPEVVVITCGKDGGIMYDGDRLYDYPIYPADVVDSNGSGDVFHGAFAFGIMQGYDYLKCCHFSSAVSALKCTGVGSRQSVPDFETVKKYMKENGYEL